MDRYSGTRIPNRVISCKRPTGDQIVDAEGPGGPAGHHAPGTNIEFIVMQLLRAGRLGAFDFNSRYYADDDLVVGSADPFQLFRIMTEIAAAGAHRPGSRVGGERVAT
jgi:hypothetical protein